MMSCFGHTLQADDTSETKRYSNENHFVSVERENGFYPEGNRQVFIPKKFGVKIFRVIQAKQSRLRERCLGQTYITFLNSWKGAVGV